MTEKPTAEQKREAKRLEREAKAQAKAQAEGAPIAEVEGVSIVEAPQEITPEGRLAMRQEQFAVRTKGWASRPADEITHTLWQAKEGHIWILDEVDGGLYRAHQVDHLLK